mmetsp:Transcript_82950/g.130446  ORF Transcript_82950/g.130446 Transcript_82950/m.130446 type:complete len:319 (-) Transcript_82950:155-1111(-)
MAEDASQQILILTNGLITAMTGDLAAINGLPKSAPNYERDFRVFGIFTFICFALNWGLRLLLVKPLAGRVLNIQDKSKAKLQEKYAQSIMEIIFYGAFTILGCCVVPRQEWVWPSRLWWDGFKEGGHEVMRDDLRCYYLLYGARYFSGIVSIFLEHKRRDFLEMLAHHVTSVLLVFLSFGYGWNRIGAIIMCLMDPADVFLHIAKSCKYTSESIPQQKPRNAMWELFADIWFALFTIVFIVTRIVMYPYVCWSAQFETYWQRGFPEYACLTLLFTLLSLQIFWFYLIVRVIVRKLRNGAVEDVRSDSEDEDAGTKKNT